MGIDDPVGVWKDLSEEKMELLEENMYASPVEAKTEWTEEGVRWDCPECDSPTATDKFYGTKRCDSCMKIMQSENWETGDAPPDPYEEEEVEVEKDEGPKQNAALSW